MKSCILSRKKLFVWLFKNNLEKLPISKQEKNFSNFLSRKRSEQYQFSRGYMRYVLSKLFNLEPLEIPLLANLGEAPVLPPEFGFLSISHSKDALLISWSIEEVGVDIERFDRQLYSPILLRKYLNEEKHFQESSLSNEKIREQILNIWVVKEALVKWERSSIAQGFKNWDVNTDFTFAINTIKREKVSIKKMRFQNWNIGIACNKL